ncbi:hypothetical protein [Massilia haematophila]|uniref:LIM zinc-binding domain-containing protein n=1 Tax=Massilia haematophila TaxID=457923 RepID=A0ABV7PER0_9BURK
MIDHLDGEQVPLTLLTFGSVREICPKCQRCNLKLVLPRPRYAWPTFCAECESCFDAQYANGEPALSI